MQQADDASIHLLGIINDVLDIAKIEADKLSVSMEPVDLSQLLDEVVDLQALTIKSKGLELKYNRDQQQNISIYADPAKLKQVLINVIGNAVKFTEFGTITISTHIEEDNDKDKAKSKSMGDKSDSSLNSQNNKSTHNSLTTIDNLIDGGQSNSLDQNSEQKSPNVHSVGQR